MGLTYTFVSGDQARPVDVSRIALVLGACRDGTAGTSYTFDPGDDVQATLGPGRATALALLLGQGGRCVVSPCVHTYAALPAVVKVGTGTATITIAQTSSKGPHDTAPLKLTVTSDATAFDVSYDGTSTAETLPLPPALPAVMRGTVDLSSGRDLEGLQLVFSAPAAKTLTFAAGTLASAPAGVLDPIASKLTTAETVLAAACKAPSLAELALRPRRLVFTTGGSAPAEVASQVTITGLRAGGTVDQTEVVLLSQTPGAAVSLYEYQGYTSFILAADGGGTGGTVQIGYSSRFATSAEIVAAIDALAVAAPLAVTSRIYEDGTGAEYLEVLTTATGAAAGINLTGSAAAAEIATGLDISETAAGSAGTRAFDWLGITATFSSTGTWIADDTHSAALVGPRPGTSSYVNALNSALDNYTLHPFGFVVVAEDPSSNAQAAAIYEALRAIQVAKSVDPDDPIIFDVLTPTALHTASSTRATNDANVATWTTALQTAFANATASLNSVAANDCYISGLASLPGSHRRPAAWAGALHRAASDRIASNPCDGRASCTLLAPDGLTYARDESRATTKLGSLSGAGFWVLKSMSGGGTKFAPSASRAGSLNRYRNPGTVAIAMAMGRAIQAQLVEWEGTWDTDPSNPTAASPVLIAERQQTLERLIDPIAFPGRAQQTSDAEGGGNNPNKPANVAAFSVTISAPTVADDGEVSVSLEFNPLAVAETIAVTITATSVALE